MKPIRTRAAEAKLEAAEIQERWDERLARSRPVLEAHGIRHRAEVERVQKKWGTG
jgi:hypothetical protein